MRSVVRAAVLGGCGLLLGAGLFQRSQIEAGTVTGEVSAIGPDSVLLAREPGVFSRLLGARRFPIAPLLAPQLRPGDRIQAELVPDPSDGRWIGRLRFLRRAERTPELAEGALPAGAQLPALVVPGIDGPFSLGAGQGTPTVLAFFYTSCGIPTACPLLTQKLHRLQEEIRGHGRIVTLTLDPEVDTLATLSAYAARHHAERGTWQLGRLDDPELAPLLRKLGIARVRSNGQLVHSLHLSLLDGAGRLVWRSEGNEWEVHALAERLRALQARKGGSV